MAHQILVAGATGALGREVIQQLSYHNLKVLTRSRERALSLLPDSVQIHEGDALKPESLSGLCDGVDVVISCLGASVGMQDRERRSYLKVDTPANLRLIELAKAAGVQRFVYVSLWIQPGYAQNGYVQAHQQVEAALAQSGLDYSIVRPTGLFSAMLEFLRMAEMGAGMLPGGGSSRSNPVHQADVADVIVGLLDSGASEIGVGGPEVFSRRQILDLAFNALERKPRYVSMPAGVMGAMGSLIGLFDGRTGDLMRFFSQVASVDCIAPRIGKRQLGDYFKQAVADSRSTGERAG
ncbi:MAG: hypothetical protein CVV27_09985 [Candidatus Melainabacteria bacterium HGW-Melainabacteria-1]|nr:MAG: hypothetical protein CVV27_09985 [Candidatus Melainabacteria bacterium HGW-Melainabacteria-1]